MSAPSEDSARLLSMVSIDGAPVGNQRLRETLGWDETRYLAAREPLLDAGLLVTGRGKGGSVKRPGADDSDTEGQSNTAPAPDGEMFSPETVTAPAPVRPGRGSSAPRDKAPSVSPVTTYQFPDSTRKNIPPAGLATKSTVQETLPHRLAYFYFVKFPVAQASSLCGQRASSPLIPQFNKVELRPSLVPCAALRQHFRYR